MRGQGILTGGMDLFGRKFGVMQQVGELRGKAFGQGRRVATVAAGVLAVGVGFHVMFGHNGLTAYEQKKQDAKALEVQVKTLERENEQLRGHVDRLQTDPNAIEHQAREELHYTRPGEVIVTLPPDAPVKK